MGSNGMAGKRGQTVRMGRPTLDQAGEIDADILRSAIQLFLEKGFDATSMEAIARTAAVSKRTLYLRYASKEALMAAVVVDRVTSWSAASSKRDVDAPTDFKGRLIWHAQTLALALGDKEVRAFDRLGQSAAARFPALARAFYELGYRYELDFLTTEIAKGTAKDGAPARHPEQVAQQIMSMISGWRRTEELVRELDDDEVAEFAKRAVETLFSGRDVW